MNDVEAVVERDDQADYRVHEKDGPLQVLFAKPFGELYVCYFVLSQNHRGAAGHLDSIKKSIKTVSVDGIAAINRLPCDNKEVALNIAIRLKEDKNVSAMMLVDAMRNEVLLEKLTSQLEVGTLRAAAIKDCTLSISQPVRNENGEEAPLRSYHKS